MEPAPDAVVVCAVLHLKTAAIFITEGHSYKRVDVVDVETKHAVGYLRCVEVSEYEVTSISACDSINEKFQLFIIV